MKILQKTGIIGLAAVIMLIAGCSEKFSGPVDNQQTTVAQGYDNTYIIELADGSGSTFQSSDNYSLQKAKEILQSYKIGDESVTQVYNYVFHGFAVKLTNAQLELLAKDSRIKSIEPDRLITLPDEPVTIDAPAKQQKTTLAQTIPWGVAAVNYKTYTGTHRAWIVDTGIDLDHSDLNVNTGLSVSYVRKEGSPDDQNGHGTHCAGIIGAKDNTIGVVGVAAGANVVAVKTLNKNGSGMISDIIKGLDYIKLKASSGDVCSMSLGGGPSIQLDNAVKSLADKGVLVVIAAGNSKAYAGNYSPARVEWTNVYTISAHDANDVFAYFSNYGNPPIEYCAPGVSIYSTYKNNQYATMSGTSMSTPHVAGILLFGADAIGSRGYVINDPDGKRDPLAALIK